MTERNKAKRLAGFLVALGLGALLASATIVPPERVASCLRPKVGEVTEDCKPAAKTAAKKSTAPAPPEVKKSTESGHPRPDPIRNLLRGILL
jgi:hypothetical protein